MNQTPIQHLPVTEMQTNGASLPPATDLAATPQIAPGADSKFTARAKARKYDWADKQRIVERAKHCTAKGAIGALLRSEGVSSSSLSAWRREFRTMEYHDASTSFNPNPMASPHRPELRPIEQLSLDKQKLQAQLDHALLVIEIQRLTAALITQITPISQRGGT